MKYLTTKRSNIILTIVVASICSILLVNSGVLDNAGMAVIIMIWLPTLFGLVTIVGYFIFNIFSKKYAPFVTIIGNLINLFIAIGSFWS